MLIMLQARAVELYTKLKEDAKGSPDEKSAEYWLSFAQKHKVSSSKFLIYLILILFSI